MRLFLRFLYRIAAKILVGTGIEKIGPIGALNKFILSFIHTSKVDVNGLTFHLDKDDAMNLSVFETFEPVEHALFQQEINPGDIVIDIGANIGYFTVHFSRLVGEEGHVHAFEPDPDNFELLKKNLQENSCENVQGNLEALSDITGTSKLYLSNEECVDHHLYSTGDERKSIDVRTVSLDDYCREHSSHIDFIKMDIQGAEPQAFAGMGEAVQGNPKVKLLTEYWPFGLNASGSSGEAYLEMLLGAGFELHEHSKKTDAWVPVSKESLLRNYTVDNQVHTNLYCTRTP